MATLFGITGIGTVALTVGLIAYGSYKGAEKGEALYYNIIQGGSGRVRNENKYFYEYVEPLSYPSEIYGH